MAPSKEKWVRRFIISETNRHKKGFTIYKVTSLMFMKSSPNIVSKVSIWKRYSDFKKLYNTLKLLHSTLQIKESFPPFPKPKFFGRFEAEVIDERRECALRFLDFIGQYDVLFTSEPFVKFFENDNENKWIFDCSQSLSSDASEDDRNVNCENGEVSINNKTDLPKFVCTKKVTPIVVEKEGNIKSEINQAKHLYKHFNENSNNNSIENKANDTANGIEALTYDKYDFQGEDTVSKSVVIHDGSDLMLSITESAQYILIAAAHMSAAFRHEAIAEYEEAFTQYKLGISHLINGLQTEDEEKKAIIQEKITKYSQRAERLYNRHLNCNISVLYKSVAELRNYKVIELIESIMIVKDILQGFKRVIKTVEKVAGCKKEFNAYILRGKVPYMVQLYSFMQTDFTVFLVLQYLSKGKLWNFAKSKYKTDSKREIFAKKGHSRSFSCDAAIQIDDLEKSSEQENLSKHQIKKEKVNTSAFEINGASPLNNFVIGDTKELVKNAQKLLKSVSDTLKRSNSITVRLNESSCLLYKESLNNEAEDVSDWKDILKNNYLYVETAEDTQVIEDISEDSLSDSYINLQDKDGEIIKKNNGRKNNNTIDNNLTKINSLHIINSSMNKKSNGIKSFIINENPFQFKKMENYLIEDEQRMWSIPESVVKIWTAQILLALEALHQQDVILSDLRPDNILIDDNGNACMTYMIPRKGTELLRLKRPYSSPELCMFIPPISITTSADVWSFGILLYELLTGFDFETKHSGKFHTHSLINIPDNLSENATSLLLNILKYQPSDRFSIPEIKQHLFYANINWLELLNTQE